MTCCSFALMYDLIVSDLLFRVFPWQPAHSRQPLAVSFIWCIRSVFTAKFVYLCQIKTWCSGGLESIPAPYSSVSTRSAHKWSLCIRTMCVWCLCLRVFPGSRGAKPRLTSTGWPWFCMCLPLCEVSPQEDRDAPHASGTHCSACACVCVWQKPSDMPGEHISSSFARCYDDAQIWADRNRKAQGCIIMHGLLFIFHTASRSGDTQS